MNINVNSLEADAALALDPLHLPGSTQNVQPPGYAHLGVPQSIYPAPPPAPAGLAIVIDPWTMLAGSPKGALGGVFAAYDSVKVWLNGIATSTGATVLPGDETKRILLYLPLGLLRDGINKMSYRVERLGGNYEDSRILDVLYNNPASGIAVNHPPSIAPGQPATFTFTRNYPREYDVMTLIIGRWSKTIPYVHPANPVTYTLTTTDLQQIGDGTHPVDASVIDQLTNSNVSPTTSITITANQKVYNPPIIVEAEANNRVLNVAALNGQNATIHALTWTGMVDGQPCWLKLLGFKADGSAHDLQLWNGLPARTNPNWISQGKYPQPVLNSYLAQLGDGRTLTVQFWVSEDKSNNFATAKKFPDQVYTIKAVEDVKLSISSIKGLAGGEEIPEGATTSETLFAMSGKAKPNATIYLRIDGVRQSGLIAVDGNADWTHNTGTQIAGLRSYTIEGNYDSGPVSAPPRTVNISQPLSIDNSVLLLDGLAIDSGGYNGTSTGDDAIGNSAVRQATGGSPPYTYKSSNVLVTIDQTGYVKARFNGVATITVTDSRGAQVSYRVAAANVFQVHPYFSARPWTYPAYMAAQQRFGYSGLTADLRSVLLRCFKPPFFQWQTLPGDYGWKVWTGGNVREALNVRTGQFYTADENTDMSHGIGFKPRQIISDGLSAASAVSQDDSPFIVPPPDTAES